MEEGKEEKRGEDMRGGERIKVERSRGKRREVEAAGKQWWWGEWSVCGC